MLQPYHVRRAFIFFICSTALLLLAIPASSQGQEGPQPVITLKLKIAGSVPNDVVIVPLDEVIGTRAIKYPESALKDGTEGRV